METIIAAISTLKGLGAAGKLPLLLLLPLTLMLKCEVVLWRSSAKERP